MSRSPVMTSITAPISVGEVGDHAGLGEFEGDGAAEHNADDADD